MGKKFNIAVFASGGGSNFQAIIDKVNEGLLHVNIALMIGNNVGAESFLRARRNGIKSECLPPTKFDEQEYTKRLLSILKVHDIDLIVLAGYMKKIPVEVIKEYRNKIVNIHPGLLPEFGGKGMFGMNVHKKVIESKASESGVTIHFVDEKYDNGPIIVEKTVPVFESDTPEELAKRVLIKEHATYWRVIEAIAQGRIYVRDGLVEGKI